MHHAEEKEPQHLLEAYELMKAAFENAYEGIVITDKQGFILMMNETYAKFLRVQVNEVIGRHVTEVIENTRMHIVAQTGKAELAQVQQIRGGNMLVHRIPIIQDGQLVAVVGKVLFQDVKELYALSERVQQLEEELNYYKGELLKHAGVRYSLDDMIGNSPAMQKVKQMAKRVATSDTTVFIGGESGTGKEMLAHAIHQLSRRRLGPFVKVNCAAIPESLLESVLFGYAEGAFTGAVRGGRKGKFEMAHRGSIFLDEIGELSLPMQAKLLRVLQEKEIEPVGAVHPIKVDVRIIAASNRNLEQMVKENRFREDLYYRLNVVTITLPPLRERKEDIPELTHHLLEQLAHEIGIYAKGITPEAMECLLSYHWPGNIRELRNVLERSLHMMEGSVIQKEHLPYHFITHQSRDHHHYSLRMAIEQAERDHIQCILKITQGDREQAIRLLGISRASFYNKLKKYQLYSTY
ncbi:sigma-54 interaction domain-containing protein [Thermoflavimicrobium dichotomicum]|uniref:PAS domain S-box-containing protein n=1 Tax=Thermoflavimicrobium dichotomicum TaxID=46223 RepID=A0A1I3ULQ4_9BACL|nr:sigma 54-interacting transcriptional regulator [Thermoflavimicrobium dichotomicum]SFJ84414.1 PAS domain S-box-containing protein [Thermoflavimicrobium dichotomicum]